MKRVVIPAAVVCAAAIAIVAAKDTSKGLQPGDHAEAFEVKACTGPAEGESLCYR